MGKATSIRNVIVVGSAGMKKFTVRTGTVRVIAAYFLLFPSLVFLTVLVVAIRPKSSKAAITTLLLLSKTFVILIPVITIILFVATETPTLVIVVIFPILAFTSIFFLVAPHAFFGSKSFDEMIRSSLACNRTNSKTKSSVKPVDEAKVVLDSV